MLARLFSIRPTERRYLLVLGCFAFFQLAATTILSATSDVLFLDSEGADRLPYGLVLGQIIAILGFACYRVLRTQLRTVFLNPTVVLLLATGLVTVYYFVQQRSSAALYLLIGLGPLYGSVLGSEYGRLSAAFLDARSARRLLPLLGAIGGLGATAGAYSVRSLMGVIDGEHLLLLSAALMLVVTIPALNIRESIRPRVTSAKASSLDVVKQPYAVALIGIAMTVIAISTVVRYQFGAAAEAIHSGAALGEYFGNFYMWLNIASIAFTLLISRLLINWLGAARALLVYPAAMAASIAGMVAAPSLLTASISQFTERLLRQNVHRPNSAITTMPISTPIRIQLAMILSGTLSPITVIATSLAILFAVGNLALPQFDLGWQDLAWPLAGLVLLLLGLAWYVRQHYPTELQGALRARRLHSAVAAEADVDLLGSQDLPFIDPQLRLMLHGYLASDLPERTSLALEMLSEDNHTDTLSIIKRQWPLWEPWLKCKAVALLAAADDPSCNEFLVAAATTEPDEVRAVILQATGNAEQIGGSNIISSETLWQWVDEHHSLTAAQALVVLAQRDNSAEAAEARLQLWFEQLEADNNSTSTSITPEVVAQALAQWPTALHDAWLPKLLRPAPVPILGLVAKRPTPEYAPLCIPYLGNDATYNPARIALSAIGEPAVPALEEAAINPLAPNSSFDVISNIQGHSAHLASMRLMAHPEQRVRHRASVSRAHSEFDLSAAEQSLVSENLDAALDQCTRYHSYSFSEDELLNRLACGERDAALESVFLNLSLTDNQGIFRRAYLAQGSSDARQKAFALELLDELLPRKIKSQLLPILEGQAPHTPADAQGDRHWLELQQRLMDGSVGTTPFQTLLASEPFAHWRVGDLETLRDSSKLLSPSEQDVQVVLRDGQATSLEQTLLQGATPEQQQGDHNIALSAVYRVIRQQPRCGALWLQHLAERIPVASSTAPEITRSSMVSLASRTLAEDNEAASELGIWQRMFFLRSCAFTQDLPPARLRLLAEISRSLSASAGEMVVQEGRLGNHFYLVCNGRLRVSQGDNKLAELGPADGFGALALMRGERRSLSVHAEEDSELLAISRVDFLDLIEVHPSLVRSLARTLAAQILASQSAQTE